MKMKTRSITALILAAVLLFCYAAAAAEEGGAMSILEALGFGTAPAETASDTPEPAPTVTPSPEDFRFRDGIRWGMSPQQVKAFESEEMIEKFNQDWSIMMTKEKVAVSRYTADLVFMFRQGELRMITYEFSRTDADTDFQYLTGALSSVYGEARDADPAIVKTLMDAINPGRYQTERMKKTVAWVREDGTSIFLYFTGENAFSIMYAAPELGGGLYQVKGL